MKIKPVACISFVCYIACASFFFLIFGSPVSAQVAVEYGIMGSKSAPLSGIGKALEGRFGALSKQATASGAQQTPPPQRYHEQTGVSSADSAATPTGPSKFTIHSSEGAREVTVEQPGQEKGQEK